MIGNPNEIERGVRTLIEKNNYEVVRLMEKFLQNPDTSKRQLGIILGYSGHAAGYMVNRILNKSQITVKTDNLNKLRDIIRSFTHE